MRSKNRWVSWLTAFRRWMVFGKRKDKKFKTVYTNGNKTVSSSSPAATILYTLAVTVCLTASIAKAGEPVVIIGNWLNNAENSKLEIKRWQTSDLTFEQHTKTWWSIGDQNAKAKNERPDDWRYLYKFTQLENSPKAEAILIQWSSTDLSNTVVKSIGDLGADYEGLVADPKRTNYFFVSTEGSAPNLLEIEYIPNEKAAYVRNSVQIENPLASPPNGNAGWEGITITPDGESIILATEDSRYSTKLYHVSVKEFHQAKKQPASKIKSAPFCEIDFKGKFKESNAISGLCMFRHDGQDYLAVLERNIPFIYFFVKKGNTYRSVGTIVKFDLQAPSSQDAFKGFKLKGASPEGIAINDKGILTLISDPAEGYYQTQHESSDKILTQRLRDKVPLVFKIELSKIIHQ